jgi:hypothetical protein
MDFRQEGLRCLITFPIDRQALTATEDEAGEDNNLENDIS